MGYVFYVFWFLCRDKIFQSVYNLFYKIKYFFLHLLELELLK